MAAVRRGISVAHVEAGLCSFDRSMPEASPEGRTLLTASCDEIVAVAQAAGRR